MTDHRKKNILSRSRNLKAELKLILLKIWKAKVLKKEDAVIKCSIWNCGMHLASLLPYNHHRVYQMACIISNMTPFLQWDHLYFVLSCCQKKKTSLVNFLSWSLYSGWREANTRKWAETLAQGHRKRDGDKCYKADWEHIGEDSTFKYSVLIKRKNDLKKLSGLGIFTLYEFPSKMTPVIWQSCHQSPKISESLKF